MCRRKAVVAVICLCPILMSVGQPANDGARPVDAGSSIELNEGIVVEVSAGNPEEFDGIETSGVPWVAQLAFDAGETNPFLTFYPSPAPETSSITLVAGDQKFAPLAMKFLGEPDEVTRIDNLLLSPKTGQGFVARAFSGKGTWLFLFDPPADAKPDRLLAHFRLKSVDHRLEVLFGNKP